MKPTSNSEIGEETGSKYRKNRWTKNPYEPVKEQGSQLAVDEMGNDHVRCIFSHFKNRGKARDTHTGGPGFKLTNLGIVNEPNSETKLTGQDFAAQVIFNEFLWKPTEDKRLVSFIEELVCVSCSDKVALKEINAGALNPTENLKIVPHAEAQMTRHESEGEAEAGIQGKKADDDMACIKIGEGQFGSKKEQQKHMCHLNSRINEQD